MKFPRLPRFKRAHGVPPMQLTERDRDIIRLVHRHRFLRSPQIAALMDDRSQQLLRRLQVLYHHGYLERPRAQIDYYHQGGTRHIVYGLGSKGGKLVQRELCIAGHNLSWGEKNRSVRGMFLEHALLVSDVMVALELACRKTGRIRLLAEEELSFQDKMSGVRYPVQWKVKLNGGPKLGVIPDRVFALEFPEGSGATRRIHFFLEADQGTMPVQRRTLSPDFFFPQASRL